GLLIYTPICLFALWSMVRGKWRTPLAPWLTALAILHWFVISSHTINWWAGHCYGPRFFTDLTPVFVLFLIPYVEHLNSFARWRRAVFIALALVSGAMHLRGGWSKAVYYWNIDPVYLDQHPERNWDWSDPPFLRWRVNVDALKS